MNRDALRRDLRAHDPVDPAEERALARILRVLDADADCFSRRFFEPGHLTASAIVVSPDERCILLIQNKAFGFWMQPGGHVDASDESMRAAALRELEEEAGLSDVVSPDWAPSILDLDVHDVPARLKKDEPAHNHFDVRYCFRAKTLEVRAASDAKDAAWFPLDGLEEVETDASVRLAAARVLARLSPPASSLQPPASSTSRGR